MNCKHCNIAMKLVETSGRFLCEACQHSEPVIPVAPASSNSEIKPLGKFSSFMCEACDERQLEIGLIHRTEVCFCGNCGGFAIDRPSLGDLVEDLRARYEGCDSVPVPFDPQQFQVSMNCLACHDPVEPIPFAGPGNVVIATCETCKISWVKDGELDRIVRAPGRRFYELKLPGYRIRQSGNMLGTVTISHYG